MPIAAVIAWTKGIASVNAGSGIGGNGILKPIWRQQKPIVSSGNGGKAGGEMENPAGKGGIGMTGLGMQLILNLLRCWKAKPLDQIAAWHQKRLR